MKKVFLLAIAVLLVGCQSDDGSGDTHCSVYSQVNWYEDGENYRYEFAHNECNWVTEVVTTKKDEIVQYTVTKAKTHRITEFVSDNAAIITHYSNETNNKMYSFSIIDGMDNVERTTYSNGEVFTKDTFKSGTAAYRQAKNESDRKMARQSYDYAIGFASIDKKF